MTDQNNNNIVCSKCVSKDNDIASLKSQIGNLERIKDQNNREIETLKNSTKDWESKFNSLNTEMTHTKLKTKFFGAGGKSDKEFQMLIKLVDSKEYLSFDKEQHQQFVSDHPFLFKEQTELNAPKSITVDKATSSSSSESKVKESVFDDYR